jgi:hypothetical protein
LGFSIPGEASDETAAGTQINRKRVFLVQGFILNLQSRVIVFVVSYKHRTVLTLAKK